MTPDEPAHVEVRDLAVHFGGRQRWWQRERRSVRAVDGVDLTIPRGATLGLVGESGSGKTTLGRALLRLVPVTRGHVRLGDAVFTDVAGRELRRLRRHNQIVFQDPYSSLNPRMTVGRALREPLDAHGIGDPRGRPDRVRELLEQVGLDPRAVDRYPHEFSGGQRQRIGIARALAVDPAVIVADEPTSALDVSVRAQIANLLQEVQERLDLTVLFISHDLSIVEHLSDRVAVMYLGRLVEVADTARLVQRPAHPYTAMLLSSILHPDPDRPRRERIVVRGDIPDPAAPPPGCRFHPRCPLVTDRCREDVPVLRPVAGALVACHHAETMLEAPGASLPEHGLRT